MSGVYFQGGGTPQRDTTMRDLIGVLFKYKWLIVGITAFALVFVVYKTVRAPVTYQADATLLLDRQGARASVLERSGRSLPWVEVVESEVQVLQSTPVLQGALDILREEGVADGMTLGRVSRAVKAGIVNESNVVYVSATMLDPELAVHVANAVSTSYTIYHRKLFSLPDPSPFLQVRADSIYTALGDLQQRRSELYSAIGVTDVEEQERSLIREASVLRADLSKTQVRAAALEAIIENARQGLESGNLTLTFQQNTGSLQGQNMSQRANDYAVKSQQLEQLRFKYTDQHPQIRELAATVEGLRTTLEGWIKDHINIKENELRVVRAESQRLAANLAEMETRLAALPQLVQEVEMVETRLASVRQQYRDLSDQIVTTTVNSVSYRDYGVKILSPAVGAKKNRKGDPVRLALGPLLALLAGIGLAFYLENLDHTLRNREDVEEHFEIPVLASFPEVELEAETPSTGGGGRRLPYQKKSTR